MIFGWFSLKILNEYSTTNATNYFKLRICCLHCKKEKEGFFKIDRCTNIVINCMSCLSQESFPIQSILHEYLLHISKFHGLLFSSKRDDQYVGKIKGYEKLYFQDI